MKMRFLKLGVGLLLSLNSCTKEKEMEPIQPVNKFTQIEQIQVENKPDSLSNLDDKNDWDKHRYPGHE